MAIALQDAPFLTQPARTQPPLPEAPFAAAAPDMALARQHFDGVRNAQTFTDYLAAGWQQSVTGLATRGKLPDVQVDPAASAWYDRFASSLAGIAGDVPAIAAGFVGGSAAGGALGSAVPVLGTAAGATMGSFGGAAALPAGLRTAMMDSYAKGEITSSSDFIDRAMHTAWASFKAGTVGVATGGAGVIAKAALPVAASAATQALVPTAAEIGTMATVSKGLEGKLPEPRDFLDAAVMIGGAKAAPVVAARLRAVYAQTGKTPTEVVSDAAANPELAANLAKPLEQTVAGEPPMIEIPPEYMPLAARENARSAIPDVRSPEQAAMVAAKSFAEEIPQAPGEPAQPTHVNYNFISTSADAQATLARLSEVYERDIQAQRRGNVSWEETSAEAERIIGDTLGGVDTTLIRPRDPGTPAGAAEILARKQMVIGAAEDLATRAKEFAAMPAEARTPEATAQFYASIERTAMIQSEFLGARAEAGRALNILKNTAQDADRAKAIQRVIDMYGAKDPAILADMIGKLDNPAAVFKFAKEAVKATTWEKVVEAWKAGLLSGPITHTANMLGNTAFFALRAPIDGLAAAIGQMRGASAGDRVALAEPLGRLAGGLMGTVDGLRTAGAVLRTGENPLEASKGEVHRGAIEGVKGEVVRLPFRLLGAEDAIFKVVNERGELYSLAMRQASTEGLNVLTAEYRARVADLVQNPTAKMADAAKDAADRFTFNKELGDKGQAVQTFVRAWHLEWLLPFIRTPSNIIKELARMTPFAPLVKEWRDAMAEGGIARDKAIAEVGMGMSIMSLVVSKALAGQVSGAGEPDPGKRRVAQAAGWQPYSVKVGDTWYSYERLQPVGTLVGLAADLAEVWDHLTPEESDKVPKMLSVAFANAVTNQTFLSGITQIVNATSDPKRFGPRWIQGMAGTVVPALVAQTANMTDPVAREVNGVIDAIRSRIPGAREGLLPKRDVFGEPEANKDRVGGVLPIVQKTESDDKVRTEAMRLGISAADAPKKAHVGRGTGKLGQVDLTPEQRDRFSDVGGHLAHEILDPVVNSPQWAKLPDLVQKKIYAKAFMAAHKHAALAALPPDVRAPLIQDITEKITAQLAPEED